MKLVKDRISEIKYSETQIYAWVEAAASRSKHPLGCAIFNIDSEIGPSSKPTFPVLRSSTTEAVASLGKGPMISASALPEFSYALRYFYALA